MAKLTTQSTGTLRKRLVIQADEIEAMLRERYPDIATNAKMTCQTDVFDELAEVQFAWNEDRAAPQEEIEVQPAGPKCRRQCTKLDAIALQEAAE